MSTDNPKETPKECEKRLRSSESIITEFLKKNKGKKVEKTIISFVSFLDSKNIEMVERNYEFIK